MRFWGCKKQLDTHSLHSRFWVPFPRAPGLAAIVGIFICVVEIESNTLLGEEEEEDEDEDEEENDEEEEA